MKVNRNELLLALSSTSSGLSGFGIVEQSNCFAFNKGQIRTYNEEISCRIDSPLGTEIEGAVAAAPFLSVLGKMVEDDVEVEQAEAEIIIKGKRRRFGITCEAEVLLPDDIVEEPKGWKPLPEAFVEGLNIVRDCVGKDSSKFALLCVHVTKDFVEACDNFQVARYPVEVPINTDILIKGDSVKELVGLGCTHVSHTENWIHFRNAGGLVFSCRLYKEEYPDFDAFLVPDGKKVNFPGKLAEVVDRAEVFSSENMEANELVVDIKPPDKMKIESRGVNGWYQELKKVKYSGDPIKFRLHPRLLARITEHTNECMVGENRLVVNVGKFTYATSLGVS